MTWRDDCDELRRLAAQRRVQHGETDELAASFERIAEKVEAERGGTMREPGES